MLIFRCACRSRTDILRGRVPVSPGASTAMINLAGSRFTAAPFYKWIRAKAFLLALYRQVQGWFGDEAMTMPKLLAVLRHVRRVADAEAARDLTDSDLLDRFVSRRDEAAF